MYVRRRDNMKEILKSKAIMFLFILMLGFVYVKSAPTNVTDLKNEPILERTKDTIVCKNN